MKYIIAIFLAFSISFCDEIDDFESEFESTEDFDPLYYYNDFMTGVNDFIYKDIFTPILIGYDYIMPDAAQNAIGNFFDNLMFPIRFVNNLLQFKFKNAGEETLRFIANTIVGFGGISDVATNVYGLERHDEDLGQTLGYWGIGSGFPIVLPILGQSNLRDLIGLSGDYFVNPLTYSDNWWARDGYVGVSTKAGQTINEQSQDPQMYENMTKDAIKLYPFIKNAYEQRRNSQIKE